MSVRLHCGDWFGKGRVIRDFCGDPRERLETRIKGLGGREVWLQTDLGISSIQVAEKAMATHSSTLAWKIPWAEEPGRLQSMGPGRVGHD